MEPEYVIQASFIYLALSLRVEPLITGRTNLRYTDYLGGSHVITMNHETLCGPSESAYGKFLPSGQR